MLSINVCYWWLLNNVLHKIPIMAPAFSIIRHNGAGIVGTRMLRATAPQWQLHNNHNILHPKESTKSEIMTCSIKTIWCDK